MVSQKALENWINSVLHKARFS